jgi:hypothetical protein
VTETKLVQTTLIQKDNGDLNLELLKVMVTFNGTSFLFTHLAVVSNNKDFTQVYLKIESARSETPQRQVLCKYLCKF